MKNLKRILLLIILIVVLTHRHEDYCTDPGRHFKGTEDAPFVFGPFHKSAEVNSIDSMPKRDSLHKR